jgi:hypothetical protein
MQKNCIVNKRLEKNFSESVIDRKRSMAQGLYKSDNKLYHNRTRYVKKTNLAERNSNNVTQSSRFYNPRSFNPDDFEDF